MRATQILLKRSAWKGPYFVAFPNLREALTNHVPIKTDARSCTILPNFVGIRFMVHNGKEYTPVTVTQDMVGHKLGEFSHTKKRFTFKPNSATELFVFRDSSESQDASIQEIVLWLRRYPCNEWHRLGDIVLGEYFTTVTGGLNSKQPIMKTYVPAPPRVRTLPRPTTSILSLKKLPPLVEGPQSDDDNDNKSELSGSEDDHDLSGDPMATDAHADTDHTDSFNGASACLSASATGRRSRADYEERDSERDTDGAKTHSSSCLSNTRPIKRCRSSTKTSSEEEDDEHTASETEDESVNASNEDNHTTEDDTTTSHTGYDADTSEDEEKEEDIVSKAGYEADDEADATSDDEHESKETADNDNEDDREDEERATSETLNDSDATFNEDNQEEEENLAPSTEDDEARNAQESSNESNDYPSADDEVFHAIGELVRNPPQPRRVTPYESRSQTCPRCGDEVRGGAPALRPISRIGTGAGLHHTLRNESDPDSIMSSTTALTNSMWTSNTEARAISLAQNEDENDPGVTRFSLPPPSPPPSPTPTDSDVSSDAESVDDPSEGEACED
ncbi:hypothetical protein EST38_g12257 [Candolleomyces aberdarensis]|uniref:Uncharacterized protein n=1 Tax=Candolleomyces aberdarensis TaxID=2316362 RepID=A0A4Q2D5F9_9AGAR|nr:hypothetical protein EST38_g12257 [Candolleomyces aberdarensis]